MKDYLNLKSAKNVYFSCIYSILTYCICVWGGVLSSSHRADRLIKLQARCVKNLFSKFCPTNVCIFKTIELLKLKEIHKLYAGIYMYKIIRLNQCPTAQANFNLHYPEHDYNTRNRSNPRLPFPRVNAVRINYNYQCINVWNNIPENIRSLDTIKKFKSALIKYFLSEY